jgi:predicted ATPase/Tfp pilus assembly protein PilF
MGEHRLKDLIRPEHIFQLLAPGLPADFPPLKTLDNRPNNLPRQPTALIGRERATAEIVALLKRPEVALVTLIGPGGTGKTRLALQVAADMLEEFSGGSWFVELASLTDHNLVASTIGHELGITEREGEPLLETLKTALQERQVLLVLDNFEQVMDATSLVTRLLKAAPGLKVLVTSRVALRVYGEKEYLVPPLSLPDTRPGHLPKPGVLSQYEAVRLFIERAQDVKSDFEVNNDNAPAVAEICARLDGLPLAIELAAARIRILPPQALLSRLSSRLKVLTGGARDLAARQQTLRAAIDWSYDLLDEGEKQLFRRMAVFQGGRTFEAMEAVCNADDLLDLVIIDGVELLLAKSLVQQREGSDGEPRFWMLETIHEYAREKLQESGEAEELEREHALYFMRLAEEAEPQLTGEQQLEWLNRLEDEQDNIRAALRWAIGRADHITGGATQATESAQGMEGTGAIEAVEVGLRLGAALWRFWNIKGYFNEGREQLSRLLEKARSLAGDKWKGQMARALNGAGNLAQWQGDYASARALHEESLAIRREIGDKSGISASLNNLGLVAQEQGNYSSAAVLFQESLAIDEELGDKWGVAMSLNNLGWAARQQGDYASARGLHEKSLAIFREVGDKWGIALSLGNLAYVSRQQGDYTSARSLDEESLAVRRELGDRRGVAWSLNNLGYLALSQEDYASARSLREESLSIFEEIGDRSGVATSFYGLGNIDFSLDDYASARSQYEESLAVFKELGDKRGIAMSLAGLAGALLGRAASAAGGDTGGLERDNTDTASGGTKAPTQSDVVRGVKLLGAVTAMLESVGAVLEADERLPYEQGKATAHALLGEEAFTETWQEGYGISMEEAIAYALKD